MWMEPSICPSTATGLSARPQSWAAHTLMGETKPVSASTSSSQMYEVYEYVGDSPAPAPLKLVTPIGGEL